MHILVGERWESEAAAWQKYPCGWRREASVEEQAMCTQKEWAFAKTGHKTKDKQSTTIMLRAGMFTSR